MIHIAAEKRLMELLNWSAEQDIEHWDEDDDIWVRVRPMKYLFLAKGERMTIVRRLGVGGSRGHFARALRRLSRMNSGRWKWPTSMPELVSSEMPGEFAQGSSQPSNH